MQITLYGPVLMRSRQKVYVKLRWWGVLDRAECICCSPGCWRGDTCGCAGLAVLTSTACTALLSDTPLVKVSGETACKPMRSDVEQCNGIQSSAACTNGQHISHGQKAAGLGLSDLSVQSMMTPHQVCEGLAHWLSLTQNICLVC